MLSQYESIYYKWPLLIGPTSAYTSTHTSPISHHPITQRLKHNVTDQYLHRCHMDDKIGHPDFMGKISHAYMGLNRVRMPLSIILIFRDFRVIGLSERHNSKGLLCCIGPY